MTSTKHYLHFPGSATLGEVLRAYVEQDGQWWWLLITESEGRYSVCSFGSLLPYLTGRTEHIVHNVGDCAICSGMDPLLWQDTSTLAQGALADAAIRARLVADLPMAELPVVEARREDESESDWYARWPWSRAVGITENGVLVGVDVAQVKGDLGGLPAF